MLQGLMASLPAHASVSVHLFMLLALNVQDLSFPNNTGFLLTVPQEAGLQHALLLLLLQELGNGSCKRQGEPFPIWVLWEDEQASPFPSSWWGPGKEQLGGSIGYCSRGQCHADARAEITCSK